MHHTTAAKRELFLDAFTRHPTISAAAAEACVHPSTVYRWIKANERFAEAVDIIRRGHDDEALSQIMDAMRAGDLETAKWLLTRPGRMFGPAPSGAAAPKGKDKAGKLKPPKVVLLPAEVAEDLPDGQ